jgi:hypothetical protein
MATAPGVLLLVDALQRVPVDLVAEVLRHHHLRPAFARTASEGLRLVPRLLPIAYAIVPPLGDGDAFALLHRVRITHPTIPGAIVLGGPREELAMAARVLWTHSLPVAPRLQESLLAIAAHLGAGDDSDWDVTTADVGVAVAEAMHRMGLASQG